MCDVCQLGNLKPKLHTIRANYSYWKKRIDEIQKGKAVLSIRKWSGKPYRSEQIEICKLGKDDDIGVQKIEFLDGGVATIVESKLPYHGLIELATNDGLSLGDFKSWFKDYDLSKPMAIIHFTSFRY